MIGIEPTNLLLNFIILYFILYCVGSTVGRLVRLNSSSESFFVKFPVILSLGFLILIPILFITGFFIISSLVIWILVGISILLIIDNLRNKVEKGKYQYFIKITFVDNFVPLALFLLATTYFLVSINMASWAPPGDIMTGSGPLVSLILYNHKLPLNPNPILILYPPGFHLVTATFNEILGIYPVQSVFIIGALIGVLIPTTIYSITYSITNSKIFSLLSFSCIFYISSSNLEEFVTGYFYNGVYPCFAGFLILIAYTAITIRLNPNLKENQNLDFKRFSIVALLAIFALVFTYPPFALFVLVHFIIMVALKYREVYSEILGFWHILQFSRIKLSLLLSLLFIVFGISYFYVFNSRNKLEIILGYLTAIYVPGVNSRGLDKTSTAYLLSVNSLFNTINGVLIIIGIVVAIYLISRKEHLEISLLCIVIALPVLFSLLGSSVAFLTIILPKRSLVLACILSIPLTFGALAHLLSSFNNNSISDIPKLTRKISQVYKRVIPIIFVIMLSIGLLLPYASFSINRQWLWFDMGSQDFSALKWVDNNISIKDLILNDATFTSEFALSFSPKNLTYSYYSWVTNRERAEDLFDIWNMPLDGVKIFNLLKNYNVSYLLITSENSQLIWNADFSYKYIQKPYSNLYYINIFNHYSFLESVFEVGDTIIYKVQPIVNNLDNIITNRLVNESNFWASSGSCSMNEITLLNIHEEFYR